MITQSQGCSWCVLVCGRVLFEYGLIYLCSASFTFCPSCVYCVSVWYCEWLGERGSDPTAFCPGVLLLALKAANGANRWSVLHSSVCFWLSVRSLLAKDLSVAAHQPERLTKLEVVAVRRLKNTGGKIREKEGSLAASTFTTEVNRFQDAACWRYITTDVLTL